MRALTKRIFLIGASVLCVLSFFFFTKVSLKLTEVNAETPTLAQTTAAHVGDWGWNHQTTNPAVVKNADYGYTIVSNWPIANNETNLAATESETSTSITLNGKTFYELYQQDDGYRLNSQLGYFAFSVPTSALIAGKGYEYPTIEIPYGTPFYTGNYLPETTLIYKEGKWTLGEKVEQDEPVYGTPTFAKATPEFVGCWDWNHQTANPAVVKSTDYGYTIIGSWEISANSENLAATKNGASVSITLNGKSFYELYQADDGYRLNSQLGYFAFSVPTAALVAENGYEYPTIEIVNGTPFYNGNYLPETTIVYKEGAWQLRVDEVVDTTNYNPNFVSIGTFNHYDNVAGNQWGLSLVYDTTGFTTENNQVMATGFDGFTLNGEAVAPALWGANQLLFWFSKDKCEENYNGYSHATLEITEGAKVVNEKGKEFTLKALTMYLVGGAWTTEQPADYEIDLPDPLPYTGVAYGWNCMKNGAYVDTVLEFGEYGVDYLGAQADATNLAKFSSEQIATKLTINGVPVKKIEGVTVSYGHGNNYVYISIPAYELFPNKEYKCVVLHLEGNTIFKNSVLSEVTLYLLNGKWTTERPTMIEDDEVGTYLTAKDIFGGEDSVYTFADVDESTEIVSPQKVASEGTTIYNFLHKASSIDFDYSLLTHAGGNFGGVRVTAFRNEGETTQGFNLFVDGQLKGAKQILFTADEWYAIRIAVTVGNGKITASVAVDGIEIIYSETDFVGEVGDAIKLKKSYGCLAFGDFKAGDIKKPVLDWQGKDIYVFTAGEDKPSNFVFTRALNVTDNCDKADFSANNIVVTWEENALQNGKLLAGEWTITISISDKAGNVAYLAIPILVIESNDITVSFNVEGNVDYVSTTKGALLEKPVEPTKASDESANYIFDGWYVGNKKWDFANDLAFDGVELVAVFKAEYKKYTVIIVGEGLTSAYTYTFTLRFGSTLDLNVLNRDGYTYKLMKDGEEINNVTVNGDMQIKAVYTPMGGESSPDTSASERTEPQEGGCSGSLNGTFAVLLLGLAIASVMGVRKLSIKGGKEDV